jgi:nitroreductase
VSNPLGRGVSSLLECPHILIKFNNERISFNMELKEVIDKRRSIRTFEKKKVPRKIIRELIKSAMKAPSVCNRQPWVFYYVESKDIRNDISKILFDEFKKLHKQTKLKGKESQKIANNFYLNMGNAQNLIFAYRKKYKNEFIHVKPNDMYGVSCALGNLMLSAVEYNLGTCWIGTFNGPVVEKKLRKILKIQKDEELIGSLVVGYPDKNYIPFNEKLKKFDDVCKFI